MKKKEVHPVCSKVSKNSLFFIFFHDTVFGTDSWEVFIAAAKAGRPFGLCFSFQNRMPKLHFLLPELIRPRMYYMDRNEHLGADHRRSTFLGLFVTKLLVTQVTTRYQMKDTY